MPAPSVTISDAAIVIATLLGPILAVQIQKWLELARETRQRRDRVFRTLMMTRAARLSPSHIEALNMIDIEFPERNSKFKELRRAWKAYFTHLSEKVPEKEEAQYAFFEKRDDLFIEMVFQMGNALNYDFDKTLIAKNVYTTIYHQKLESDQELIRIKLVDILSGKAAFPMSVVEFPGDPELAKAQAEYMKDLTQRNRDGIPWPVKIVPNDSAAPEH